MTEEEKEQLENNKSFRKFYNYGCSDGFYVGFITAIIGFIIGVLLATLV